MNITETAIKKNRVTTAILVGLILAGIAAYKNLPRAEDPGFTIRTAVVNTLFPGASPERVEELVTDRLEEVIQEIPELDAIRSESRTGVSIIYVDIKESYTSMRPIWDNLRRKVDAAARTLPAGTLGPFVNDEFGDVFPVVLAITGDGYSYAEIKSVADEVREELLRLDDVAKVDIYGEQDERIFVEFNNARLAEAGLSPVQLERILRSRNILVSGGTITTIDDEDLALEPTGNFDTIEDLKHTIIEVPGSANLLYLEDLAYISRGYMDPPGLIMHASGLRSLGLGVSVRKGGNAIRMGRGIQEITNELDLVYPVGLDFSLITFQPEFVDDLVKGFTVSLVQAIAIVLGILLLFLGLRTGFVVASLIPTTMLVVLLLMAVFKVGLDQISIAALIIALGMLVDNAIVMSESIMVQMQQGKERMRAALDSANELKIPLITASLTTSAAFLPIYLAQSAVGEYMSSLFVVVTMALLTSWGLSITMMPLLCITFIKVREGSGAKEFDNRFYRGYRAWLLAFVQHRAVTLLVIGGAFALAIYGLTFVPKIFLPGSNSPRITASVDLPVGTSIRRTEAIVDEVERFLAEELQVSANRPEGLVSWSTYIGRGGGPRYRLSYNNGTTGPETARFFLTATSRAAAQEAIARIERFTFDNYPGMVSSWESEEMGPPVGIPVQIRVSARDEASLFALVEQVKGWLREHPSTRNVRDDWGLRTKKLVVEVDQARARRAGVSSEDIAISLQTGLSGLVTTEFREGRNAIPIILRSVAADRRDLTKLEGLNVFAQATGRSVPLKQVADITVVWEAPIIHRRDRLKTVTVQSELEPGITAAEVNGELLPWLEDVSGEWPPGSRFEQGGVSEKSSTANASIMAQLPLAFLLIFILLISQFNSFRLTGIVLLTIPLGLIGVTIGLLVADSVFGFVTLLGLVSLTGIIINNAIVLLDRIRIEITEHSRTPAQAVIHSAQQRLRPILLTTATTGGGLLPLWMSGGPFWEPMAVTIIFGLVFATVLTLGVVPVLYSVFFRVSFTGFQYEP